MITTSKRQNLYVFEKRVVLSENSFIFRHGCTKLDTFGLSPNRPRIMLYTIR